MPREDKVLWLDLETSGSTIDSTVLEVGMVVTGPGPDFPFIDAFNAVIGQPPGTVLPMQEVVLKMHNDNHLLLDLPYGRPAGEVNTLMKEFIARNFGDSTEHFILAGSGVGHFDRQFIRKEWPWLDNKLAYYCYDIGVVRRMLRMAGIESPINQANTPHRALEDVFQHIREARWLLNEVRK